MELYRLKELIYLAKSFMNLGYTEFESLIKAENELKNMGEFKNDNRFKGNSK